MPAASILIKPASSNCNMDCKYCFYKVLSSNREEYDKGFMSESTLEALVRYGIEYADGLLSFAFQGGEPTLAGLDFYRKVVSLQKKYNKKGLVIENTLQTNGLLIDDKWAAFFAENDFLIGISIDGPRKIHDKYRTDYNGNGTFERVMNTIALFRKYNVRYNVLTVITDELSNNASYLYKFYKRNNIDYVQLIPCMDEKNRCMSQQLNDSCGSVLAVEYGRFLCEIFDLWYKDFMDGEQMDIRMFSNLAQMAAGYPAEECGMNGCCSCYFVVEGDGSIYPCDFYCTDEWKLGEVGQSFNELINSKRARLFVENSMTQCVECHRCKYFQMCRGGCRRWREEENTYGVNKLCDGYKIFFEHAGDRIYKLGELIAEKYGRYIE